MVLKNTYGIIILWLKIKVKRLGPAFHGRY